ncbi:hypothetical protein SAMN06265375_10469 [Muriicola jejuensis]|uniref:Deoxyribose-phosphate aldolase n=1 Tax=Muriicola jejuensis TaxID=504488 RepID=A0A6P0UCV4_9FLAO|nr:DUF6503 family protein [Muriicola jejuensis]NER11084.1 deoxyribose-phosphate aldolase [Muriicola jejuensis]SMP23533.1 hypothetical protein SAMN06265375_10469 [Muriicola jejuensis]
MKHRVYYLFILLLLPFVLGVVSCREIVKGIDAQEIVDRAIADAGGELYDQSDIEFSFRDVIYTQKREGGRRVTTRTRETDSGRVKDIWDGRSFRRYHGEQNVIVSDSMANVYSNSINSVLYFAQLPYGLNDPSVNKEWIGEKTIDGKQYYQIRVTFNQDGGGEDFEDVYIYWFDAETFKPEYLAYEFHVNGGGLRFREAYNERYVNGIRFVDYRNYRPVGEADLMQLDSLFERRKLELLSEIRLEDVVVSRDNYN